jgi:hypothetical protein
LKSLRNDGLFTPPSFEGSVSMPGHNGGANFATSAVDPIRGEMYVVAKALPTVDRLTLPGQGGRGGRAGPIVTPEQKAQSIAPGQDLLAQGGTGAARIPVRVHESEQRQHERRRAAWSEMTAYDLNTGEIKWRIPTGTVARAAGARDSAEHRLALPAQRSAGDGWRPRLLRHRVGPPVPRLRSRQRSTKCGRWSFSLRRKGCRRPMRSTAGSSSLFLSPPARHVRRTLWRPRPAVAAADDGPPGQYIVLALKR